MSNQWSSTNRIIGLIFIDLIFTALALHLASWLRYLFPLGGALPWRFVSLPWPIYIMVAIIWLIVFSLLSIYDDKHSRYFAREIRALIVAIAMATLIFAGTLYLSFRLVSRLLFIYFCILNFIFLLATRLLARQLRLIRKQNGNGINVLIVGAGKIGQEIGQRINASIGTGWHLVGYLDDELDEQSYSIGPMLGSTNDIVKVTQSYKVDEVIIALPRWAHQQLVSLVMELQELAVEVNVVPDFFDLAFYRTRTDDLFGIPLIRLRDSAIDGPTRVVKRLIDLAIAVPGLMVSIPVLLLIALAIRWDSPGPVLFKQYRVGENGRLFNMWKFRTMVQDANDLLPPLLTRNEEGQLVHKLPNDPRVTKIGRFLRRYSLDELPQLMNVIKGEMSLVGPRPELPWLVDRYEGWQRKRFAVPPGMTGWWQIRGRSDKPLHLHVEDDLYYIQNYSILLDFHIMVKTISVVLSGRGAY